MKITINQAVAWDAVGSATGYDVELLNAAAGSILASFALTDADTCIPASLLLSGQRAGNYNVRVRAKDNNGPGPWSEVLPLDYVGLPAPGNVRVE